MTTQQKLHYIIEEDGKVWSNKSNKYLSPGSNSMGYKVVNLHTKNKKTDRQFVHRLVAKTFIPNPENKPCVNHIDGNKLNNHVSNLEWCTHLENMRHAWNNGLVPKPPHVPGEKAGNSKLKWPEVDKIRELSKSGKSNVFISKLYKMHHSTIARIVNHETWLISERPNYIYESIKN